MMKSRRNRRSLLHRAVLGLSVLVLAGLVASPAAARHDLPKVTHDGLRLVEGSGFQAFYLKPGASLARYQQLEVIDCFVSFKKHWRQEEESRGDMQMSPHQMDAIKKHLSQEFHKVFVKEMQEKGRFPIVHQTGPNVLILRPAIVNLEVEVPDSMEQVGETTFSTSAGQMTLYLELYDSVTSDLIARVMDVEGDRGEDRIQWQNSVTNKAAADRILKRWASRLRSLLEKASGESRKGQ